jgi:cold shock CspA family protein
MGIPIEIVFREVSLPREPVEAEVRKRAEKLERFHAGIINCRVVVEAPHRRRREGNIYMVKIDLAVPNRTIVVDREHRKRREHEDVFVAIRDAFDAAGRRLEEHARLERGDVKAHQSEPRGVVSRLFPGEGYGFIEEFGGREIYFHRHSVLDGFDELEVGAEVRFEEEEGEKGPQASTVKILRKPLSG